MCAVSSCKYKLSTISLFNLFSIWLKGNVSDRYKKCLTESAVKDFQDCSCCTYFCYCSCLHDAHEKKQINNNNAVVSPHPLYLKDLAACSLFLFPKIECAFWIANFYFSLLVCTAVAFTKYILLHAVCIQVGHILLHDINQLSGLVGRVSTQR